MRKKNPLEEKVKALKLSGIPLIVATHKERSDAFRFAYKAGFNIETRRRIMNRGFEVFRIS